VRRRRSAWCDLKGGASGSLAIVWTRPLLNYSGVPVRIWGQGAGAPEAQCVVRGAWCAGGAVRGAWCAGGAVRGAWCRVRYAWGDFEEGGGEAGVSSVLRFLLFPSGGWQYGC